MLFLPRSYESHVRNLLKWVTLFNQEKRVSHTTHVKTHRPWTTNYHPHIVPTGGLLFEQWLAMAGTRNSKKKVTNMKQDNPDGIPLDVFTLQPFDVWGATRIPGFPSPSSLLLPVSIRDAENSCSSIREMLLSTAWRGQGSRILQPWAWWWNLTAMIGGATKRRKTM